MDHITKYIDIPLQEKQQQRVNMQILIRKRSPGFFTCSSAFAVLVCLIVSTEWVAAWKRDMCKPGDVYVDSYSWHPAGTHCELCSKECVEECSDMDLSPISYSCLDNPGDSIRCKCCCGKSSPSSSPSEPALVPLPASDFAGFYYPGDINICNKPGETFMRRRRRDGRDCTLRNTCEKQCLDAGQFLGRTECVGGGTNAFHDPLFVWFQQCCCVRVRPSPPTPSPPPPSPPPPPPSPVSPPPPSSSPPPPADPRHKCRAGNTYTEIQIGGSNNCRDCVGACRECRAPGSKWSDFSCTKDGKSTLLCGCCCEESALTIALGSS